MRTPGFGAELAPNECGQPAVVGAEDRCRSAVRRGHGQVLVAGAHGERGRGAAGGDRASADPNSKGSSSPRTAQGAEVRRLAKRASGRASGLERSRYNLKDLLVEMVLSEWFRADALELLEDPLRKVALRDAGARSAAHTGRACTQGRML